MYGYKSLDQIIKEVEEQEEYQDWEEIEDWEETIDEYLKRQAD